MLQLSSFASMRRLNDFIQSKKLRETNKATHAQFFAFTLNINACRISIAVFPFVATFKSILVGYLLPIDRMMKIVINFSFEIYRYLPGSDFAHNG